MREEWKPVPIAWLSKAFEVSNLGNVRRIASTVPHRNNQGYRQVTFRYRGGVLTIRVHRLVASAFIRSPKNGEVVNHINGIRDDNHVHNLEWTTVQGNAKHASTYGKLKRGLEHHMGKIDPEHAFLMYDNGASMREIGETFGATAQAVCQMIKRAKKSGVYKTMRKR